MLDPGSDTIERCSLDEVSMSLLEEVCHYKDGLLDPSLLFAFGSRFRTGSSSLDANGLNL